MMKYPYIIFFTNDNNPPPKNFSSVFSIVDINN